jgi:uncharacterized protein
MVKIVLLVLGLIFVYWILKSYRRGIDRREAAPPAAAGEDMVRCAHCGLHLPRSESIATQGAYYCGVEHQRLDKGSPGGA